MEIFIVVLAYRAIILLRMAAFAKKKTSNPATNNHFPKIYKAKGFKSNFTGMKPNLYKTAFSANVVRAKSIAIVTNLDTLNLIPV